MKAIIFKFKKPFCSHSGHTVLGTLHALYSRYRNNAPQIKKLPYFVRNPNKVGQRRGNFAKKKKPKIALLDPIAEEFVKKTEFS